MADPTVLLDVFFNDFVEFPVGVKSPKCNTVAYFVDFFCVGSKRSHRRRITAAAMPLFDDERAGVRLPALFTRSCCFHHAPSTTSSATRATKLL